MHAGTWEADKPHGQGTYTYPNGDTYSGAWVGGRKHGAGTYHFARERCQFMGSWADGAFAEGKWVQHDGSIFNGAFTGSLPVGGWWWAVTQLCPTGGWAKPRAAPVGVWRCWEASCQSLLLLRSRLHPPPPALVGNAWLGGWGMGTGRVSNRGCSWRQGAW